MWVRSLLSILLLVLPCLSWAELPIDSTENKTEWEVEWQFIDPPIDDLAGLIIWQGPDEIYRTTDPEQRTATITINLQGRDAFYGGEYDSQGTVHKWSWAPFWIDPAPPSPAGLTIQQTAIKWSEWNEGLGMAQYYTDFSEYTTGEQPSDWVVPSHSSGATWTVEEAADSTGGKVLRATNSAMGRRAIVWDKADFTPSNIVEIAWRARTPDSSNAPQLDGIVQTSLSAQTLYKGAIDQFAGAIRSQEIVSGTLANIASLSRTLNSSVWNYGRLYQNIDTGAIKFRHWTGETEPTTWDLENTNTQITQAGYVGFFIFQDFTGNGWHFDWIGVGTDGSPAPTDEGFVLISPADTTSGLTLPLTLTWQDVGATQYQVQVAATADTDFASPVVDELVATNSYEITSLAAGWYRWRVRYRM